MPEALKVLLMRQALARYGGGHVLRAPDFLCISLCEGYKWVQRFSPARFARRIPFVFPFVKAKRDPRLFSGALRAPDFLCLSLCGG